MKDSDYKDLCSMMQQHVKTCKECESLIDENFFDDFNLAEQWWQQCHVCDHICEEKSMFGSGWEAVCQSCAGKGAICDCCYEYVNAADVREYRRYKMCLDCYQRAYVPPYSNEEEESDRKDA